MHQGIFVTGTGTDVGKTVITSGIVRRLRRRGLDAVPFKAVQTGVSPDEDGIPVPPDVLSYHAALDAQSPIPQALYQYTPSCSPHLAARLAGEEIDLEHIGAAVDELAADHDVLVVEGAGGVLVPLNERETMLDLMRRLGLPVLLVAPNGLGAINHTLLSLHALRAAGIEVQGVVFSNPEPQDPGESYLRDENRRAITSFGGAEILAEVRRLPPGLTDELFWQLVENDLAPLDAVFSALFPRS